ncbi:MAG: hypothetical protein BEU05_01695 [Marine Group III euryarchaeote CG-Bathy2]|uniref:Uncharacterized protein n=4 Tax=Methanobacteriati TaxID=3366610 RepID=A0A075HV79_9EURY|nr:hypothetical protein [uncultured marine group II/III euryarchaeote KM3_141_A08]AIF17748.1 hypothetical protein [uncultured marine group II/III euryarchaeote KM3_79_B02]AIF20377.1 hypothetical protein [uncultured marine group II/III euryarchaeote KM3_89_F04]OIR10244.1 MAG: hypothetical protein BEU05_01695 [Marine Group III euryarchaeote CG-Bathy2]
MFRYAACAEVPLPPGAVRDWWTDFAPDDHAGFLPFASVTRTILAQRPGTVLLVDEAWLWGLRLRVPARVRLDARGFRVRGRYPLADARYGYCFTSCHAGTRILLVAHIRLPRPLEWLLPAALRVSALLLGLEYPLYDLDFHLRQMLAESSRWQATTSQKGCVVKPTTKRSRRNRHSKGKPLRLRRL